jgi:hypothetical protein
MQRIKNVFNEKNFNIIIRFLIELFKFCLKRSKLASKLVL